MNLHRRYPMRVVTAIAVAVGLQAVAQAQVSAAATPTQVASGAGSAERATSPTAKDAWQRFLKLAANPNGIVTVDDLESAFGQKATHQSDYYRVHGFDVSLKLDSNRTARAAYPNRPTNFVSFDFPGSLISETCVSRGQALRDLQAVGWQVHSHSAGLPPQGDIQEPLPSDSPHGSYIFIKGDQGVIELGYSERTSCATTLTMESDKLIFDRVSGTQ